MWRVCCGEKFNTSRGLFDSGTLSQDDNFTMIARASQTTCVEWGAEPERGSCASYELYEAEATLQRVMIPP